MSYTTAGEIRGPAKSAYPVGLGIFLRKMLRPAGYAASSVGGATTGSTGKPQGGVSPGNKMKDSPSHSEKMKDVDQNQAVEFVRSSDEDSL